MGHIGQRLPSHPSGLGQVWYGWPMNLQLRDLAHVSSGIELRAPRSTHGDCGWGAHKYFKIDLQNWYFENLKEIGLR